jgi:hypothetical protein
VDQQLTPLGLLIWQHSDRYGHTIQNTPDPIRTPKLSWIGLD